MLPIYSKKSDQLGPLSGNISPLPRTSYLAPGRAGMKNIAQSVDSITAEIATCLPSHWTLPCMRKAIVPNITPMIIIGWRRIRRRLKKLPVVMVFPKRSS
ncbi:unknown [Parabacteroides johnsonii CAG:246]|nr:unknown [Parabacteroides johnsonii CAG:246]